MAGAVAVQKRGALPRSYGADWSARPSIVIAALLALAVQTSLALGIGPAATGLGFLALGVAFAWPVTGFATLLLLVPLRHPTGYGPMDFHTVLALVIVLGAALRATRHRPRARGSLFWVAALAYIAVAGIQVLFAPAGPAGEQRLFAELQLYAIVGGLAMILSAQQLTSDGDWSVFLDCIIAGAVLASALVIAEVTTQGASHGLFPGLYGDATLLRERPAGPFNLPNYFGAFAAVAALVALHRFSTARRWWSKFLAAGSVVTVGAALILSFSRGGLIALAAGVIFLGYSRSKLVGVAVAGGVLGLAVLGNGLFYDARLSVTNPDATLNEARAGLESSDAGRAAGGAVSLRLLEADPLFGVGFGRYHFASRSYASGSDATFSHNWYANVLAEQGVIGIGIVVLIICALIAGVRGASAERRSIALAVLVAYAVVNLFTESPTNLSASSVVWLVIGAALARPSSAVRQIPASTRAWRYGKAVTPGSAA